MKLEYYPEEKEKQVGENFKVNTIAASRIAKDGLMGGTSKAINTATDIYLGKKIDKLAQKTSSRLKERKNQQNQKENKKEKKMVGPMFWLIIMITIFKDVSDILANLTVVIAIFTFITSMFISFFVVTYLYFEGVKFETRKVAVLVINFIIGSIPLISLIPTYTASIFLIRWMENSKTVSKVTGQIAKKI